MNDSTTAARDPLGRSSKDTEFEKSKDYNDAYFEQRIPAFLTARPEVYERLLDWLDPNWFRSPETRVLLTAMKRFRKREGMIPTLEQTLSDVSKGMTTEDMPLWRKIRVALYSMEPRDLPLIERRFKALVKNQAFSTVIYDDECMEDLACNNFESLDSRIERINEIQQALEEMEDGPAVVSVLDLQPSTESDTIPTPWHVVNERIGGLRPGEVLGISGSTGDGKSLILSEITADHAQRGHNVILLDFENDNEEIVVSLGVAAKKRALGFGSAKQALRELQTRGGFSHDHKTTDLAEIRAMHTGEVKGHIAVWPIRKAFIKIEDIAEQVAAYEKATGITHDVVVLDYLDRVKDPKTIKELGVWLAQEAVLDAFQAWLRGTGKCGYTALQLNRSAVREGKKGKSRTGADVAGAFGRIMLLQNHMIIERTDEGRALVIDKCRRAGALNGVALDYRYTDCATAESSRGFITYTGSRDASYNTEAIEFEKKYKALVAAVKARDVNAVLGLTVETRTEVGFEKSPPRFAGMIGIGKMDLKNYFGGASETGLALQKLKESALVIHVGLFSFGGEKKTWVVFDRGEKDGG